jgi:hypothetical protein
MLARDALQAAPAPFPFKFTLYALARVSLHMLKGKGRVYSLWL